MQNKNINEHSWLGLEETSERVRKTAKEVAEFLQGSEEETERLLIQRKVALAMNGNEKELTEKMRFDNPIVWMSYLRKIKANTPEEIKTVGDFVEYSHTANDGSKERFNFLNNKLKEVFNTDLNNPEDFPADSSFNEFVAGNIQLGAYMEEGFANKWKDNEYKLQHGATGGSQQNEDSAAA
jgi:hypothetical protein